MTGVQKVLPKCGPAGGHFALLSYKVGSGKNCLNTFLSLKTAGFARKIGKYLGCQGWFECLWGSLKRAGFVRKILRI
jgi:hypothetical protein